MIESKLKEVIETCKNKTELLEDFIHCAYEGQLQLPSPICSSDAESERFTLSEWLWISNITLVHIVLPWILFVVLFLLNSRSDNQYKGTKKRLFYILNIFFLPFITKWNVFWHNYKLLRLNSTNPITFMRGQTIKKLKTRLYQKKLGHSKTITTRNTLAVVQEMNDEEFTTWLKYRPNRILVDLEIDVVRSRFEKS